MTPLTIVVLCFSALGAIDYIIGNKLGVGKEFEKGFMLLGNMALSMIGMIVISPWIADVLAPVFDFIYNVFKLDPSILPSSLFANDMGGASLSVEVAKNAAMGKFNALVVSSMMGCTISFTIPFALKMVKKELHRQLVLGLLCGVVTIPFGCFVAGLICQIPILDLLYNLLPLVILSAIIATGLVLAPNVCVIIFKIFGFLIKILIVVGLMLGIVNFLAGQPLIDGLGTLEEGAIICINAAVVMSGMFPMLGLLSRLLKKPMKKLGGKIGINEVSTMGVVSSLATSMTTFGVMNDMDEKGAMLNSAFAVSGAFTFAGHMAFTMAFDTNYVLPVIVGKLVSGILALVLAFFLYKKFTKKTKQPTNETTQTEESQTNNKTVEQPLETSGGAQ